MAMMRLNRLLSSSSFSRRFFEEDLAGAAGSVAAVGFLQSVRPVLVGN
jgi:hypothetical protein